MKIKALKSISGDYGFLRRGDEAEIADDIAKQLLAFGDVEAVAGSIEPAEDPKKGKADGKSKD